MDLEPSEYEPDEYDPEADLRDPSSGSITIPRVSTDESDVPADLQTRFWTLVLVINAAVLAVSLGVLLLVFEADARRGGALLGGGLVLIGLAIRRYRSFDASGESTEADSDDGDRRPSPDERGPDG